MVGASREPAGRQAVGGPEAMSREMVGDGSAVFTALVPEGVPADRHVSPPSTREPWPAASGASDTVASPGAEPTTVSPLDALYMGDAAAGQPAGRAVEKGACGARGPWFVVCGGRTEAGGSASDAAGYQPWASDARGPNPSACGPRTAVAPIAPSTRTVRMRCCTRSVPPQKCRNGVSSPYEPDAPARVRAETYPRWRVRLVFGGPRWRVGLVGDKRRGF